MNGPPAMQRATLAFWVYAAASASLLAPVVFWPLFAQAGPAGAGLEQMWLAAGACLLAAGTAADLVRAFRPRGLVAMQAVVWITLVVLGASLALRLDSPALLGALFALRTVAPAVRLWRGAHGDADWIAWARDLAAAVALFFWSAVR